MKPRELEAEYKVRLANREIMRTLRRIEEAGGKAIYQSVDVRDAKAVDDCLTAAHQKLGPIRGLVHGAGVLRDRRMEEKTVDQLNDVIDTKVAGLRHLLTGIEPGELRLLALFSSVTARYGRIGQVDYAMANEVLNKAAQKWARQHGHCRVLSFNWGPWEGGMVTDSLKKVFLNEGVGLIPLAAGAERFILDAAASLQPPVEIVVVGTLETPAPGRISASPPDSGTSSSSSHASSPAPASTIVSATAPTTAPSQVRAADIAALLAAESGSNTQNAPAGRKFFLALERELSLSRDLFLGAHILNGEPVFPMSMMFEWMGHAAIHENPGLIFIGVDRLRVLKGIILPAGKPCQLRVFATKARSSQAGLVSFVEIRGFHGGKEVVQAAGEIVLANSLPAPLPSRIHPLADRKYPLGLAEIYRRHLFHGPLLQGIQEIDGWSEQGLIAKVSSATRPEHWMRDPWRSSWLSDPLALDVAFQLMILWTTQVVGAPSLPSSAASYRQFQTGFPENGVTVRIAARQQGSYKALADIEFIDRSGTVVALMNGYECVVSPSLREAFGHRTLEQHASA